MTLSTQSLAPHNINVNGVALTAVPYTLQNGDKIVVETNLEDVYIIMNGIQQADDATIDVSNTDIDIDLSFSGSYYDPTLTINFSIT